jgi:hypothetical protein
MVVIVIIAWTVHNGGFGMGSYGERPYGSSPADGQSTPSSKTP